ncbi:hypothetical protein NFI96_026877 [Prochilodus magdalenae]|nr:hypothetical protein NFI96_026877 [Prochilodus magdalenae]
MALNVNIDNIPTTGAGPKTSEQLPNSQKTGVAASHALAEEDLTRVKGLKDRIRNVARSTGIDPAVIAAIMSRETRAGGYLEPNGWNKSGVAFGVMQIHRCNNPRGAKDSEEHITQAVGLLKEFIERMNSSWSPELRYKGGIAAYNCGPNAVTSDDVDQNTEGGDYASDVVARAQWFKIKQSEWLN